MEKKLKQEIQENQRVKLQKQEFLNNLCQKKYKNIIVITGAGISVSAGIPDFRSKENGVYSNLEKYDLPYPEAIFELDYFQDDPKPFYQLCNEKYKLGESIQPTYSHKFIKMLDDNNILLQNFTQNIDALEFRVGINPKKITNSHGNFRSCSCSNCNKSHNILHFYEHIQKNKVFECLRCKKPVKADITFYGQQLPKKFFKKLNLIQEKADLMIVMGTTLKIKPFSQIIELLPYKFPLVLINNENIFKEEIYKQHVSLFLQGDLDEICQEIMVSCDKLLKGVKQLLDENKKYEEDFSQCVLV